MPDLGASLRRGTNAREKRANRGGRASGQRARTVRMHVPSAASHGPAENALNWRNAAAAAVPSRSGKRKTGRIENN
eukprot:9477124-Pyramimonas_sp.AAC.1